MKLRLGILASHPIQYHAPLYRELAQRFELTVYFAHRQTAKAQAAAGFNVAFEWDVDLFDGYEHRFLENHAKRPDVGKFLGCDTPTIVHEIQSGQFDVFMVNGWYLKSFWQAIRACRRHGVPVMVRGDSQLGTPRSRLKQFTKEFFFPKLLEQFDACLYVGDRNLAYLEHYRVPRNRLFFAPHCVDNEFFVRHAAELDRDAVRARMGILPGQHVVLFVGKLMERKRPSDLVLAQRALLNRGVDTRVVFVGDGPLRAELKRLADKLDVPVDFLGFRNQTQLPAAYIAADVMALPSEGSETWGLVVNESLACGTPVVVSDAAGCAPDLAIEGQTGAVFPVGDIAAMADAVERALALGRDTAAISAKVGAYSVAAAASGFVAASAALCGY